MTERISRSGMALLVLLLLLPACAARRDAGEELRAAERIPVVVENRNFYQATVFATVNSARVRLGEVPGNSSASFAAPSPATGEIRIEIRLLSVGAYQAYPVQVARGDTVYVAVPPDLHRYRGRPRGPS